MGGVSRKSTGGARAARAVPVQPPRARGPISPVVQDAGALGPQSRCRWRKCRATFTRTRDRLHYCSDTHATLARLETKRAWWTANRTPEARAAKRAAVKAHIARRARVGKRGRA
jgi:hypothetical protein